MNLFSIFGFLGFSALPLSLSLALGARTGEVLSTLSVGKSYAHNPAQNFTPNRDPNQAEPHPHTAHRTPNTEHRSPKHKHRRQTHAPNTAHRTHAAVAARYTDENEKEGGATRY
jgi:hypothetical protein